MTWIVVCLVSVVVVVAATGVACVVYLGWSLGVKEREEEEEEEGGELVVVVVMMMMMEFESFHFCVDVFFVLFCFGLVLGFGSC